MEERKRFRLKKNILLVYGKHRKVKRVILLKELGSKYVLHTVSLFVTVGLTLLFATAMQSLKIGSLNVNGGRDRNKRTLISD